MPRHSSPTAVMALTALLAAVLLVTGCSSSGPSVPAGSTASAADKKLQSLVAGLTNARGEQARVDDARAMVSGADGYSDSSDPKYRFSLGRCELFDSYLVFNAVNGALATGFFDPATDQGREDLKMVGDYRRISVVEASQEATGKTEFQQRLAAYASCDSLQEIRVYAGRRASSDTVVARLPNTVDSPQSFAVSLLSPSEPQAGRIWVGGSAGGIDVIYTQDVPGDRSPTPTPAAAAEAAAAAAAAEGAAAVNAVLAKIP